jgi:hypothetical protein
LAHPNTAAGPDLEHLVREFGREVAAMSALPPHKSEQLGVGGSWASERVMVARLVRMGRVCVVRVERRAGCY